MVKEKAGRVRIDWNDMLTVIDAQNDFVYPEGALYVAGVPGEADASFVLGSIRNLMDQGAGFKRRKRLAFTEDRHPENGHIEYEIFGGKHCVAGSRGQQYVDCLMQFYQDVDHPLLLVKGEDPSVISYSIVTSPAFESHISWLRLQSTKRVFVAGWAYTHCVGESAIAYASQGFETFVIRDATRSVPPPYGNPKAMDHKLKLYGVKTVFMKDLCW